MRERKTLLLRALILLCAACFLAGTLYLAGCMAESAPASGSALFPDTPDFKVVFLDVGQGDAIFIHCQGQNMLIDAGTAKSTDSLLGFFKEQGINSLTYAVATHPHADHIGGMAAVLDAMAVGTFIMPQATHTTASFEAMLDAVERNGCAAQYGGLGQVYALGDAQVTILWPFEGEFSGSNLNNSSLVLTIEYDGVSLLLMGDAEAEVESALLEGGLGGYDILKVGHHGSKTSSTAEFIEAVTPTHAIICCGAGNDYGHPHAETLETLTSAQIWRTDVNGTIWFAVEGGVIYVQTQR